MLPSTPGARLQRARVSLEGLSVGDACGAPFEFGKSELIQRVVQERKLLTSQWHWTDDTSMALSIFQVLRQYGTINQDALAVSFAAHFSPLRGYGMGARHLLKRVQTGGDWRELTRTMFRNEGSFGNGGAMRVAPLGAYFADDFAQVIEQARLSAEITHSHPEGLAGAAAVAVAAATAARLRGHPAPGRAAFIDAMLPHIPESEVKAGCQKARDLPEGTTIRDAVTVLGNGRKVIAQGTVPYALWCAGEQLASYEEAIWLTISGGGDVDTTCAIVGGIVAAYTGSEAIPPEWLARREPLPQWAFEDM